MDENEIKLNVIKVLERNGVSVLDFESDYGIIIDSLQFITIVVDIEETFDIEIPDDYLIYDKMNNINNIITIVINTLKIKNNQN